MTPRCKTKDKKLSEEYKRGDVEFVPLTENGITTIIIIMIIIIIITELEAEAQAKKIKGFNEGATNGMVITTITIKTQISYCLLIVFFYFLLLLSFFLLLSFSILIIIITTITIKNKII